VLPRLVVGILLIAVAAPLTYISLKRNAKEKGMSFTISMALIPIVQIVAGVVVVTLSLLK